MKKLSLLLAAVLFASSILAGCSSGTSSGGGTSQEAAASSSEEAQGQEQTTDGEIPEVKVWIKKSFSEEADDAWLDSGYKLLFSGNSDSARASYYNYFIQKAGINHKSALMRRLVRMHGTPLSEYILNAIEEDS